MRSFIGVIIVAMLCLATTFLAPASAQAPSLPHAFYGIVEIGGIPAPVGSQVQARGSGVRTNISDNPIIVTVAGKYGDAGAFAAKLVVQGDTLDGTPLEFFVNGELAECAEPEGPWQATYSFTSGGITNLNLRVGTGWRLYLPALIKS